jgi:hypothetical protein
MVAAGIGMAPIATRPDDLSRNSYPLVSECFGNIADGMLYPFSWISPRSVLDGSQAFILMALFWGAFLYLAVSTIRTITVRRANRTKQR